MSETSTVPTFQDTLISTLSGLDAFAGIDVSLGIPQGQPQRTCVKFGDVEMTETSRYLGNVSRLEEYTQTVYISVVNEGVDQKTVRDTAYELRDAIAGQLKLDPSVGGTLIAGNVVTGGGWAVAGPAESVKLKANQTRRECELRFSIRCTAII
jgi:hypothetical protein